MAGLFGSAPSPPPPQPVLPMEDKNSEAARRAADLKMAETINASSGRDANKLGQTERLGETYTAAETRRGNLAENPPLMV